MHRVQQDEQVHEEAMLDLDEIARRGARRMLAEALEAEVQDYLDAARGERDEHGHALVVRNGHANEREVLCGAGAVAVKAPRVNDRRVDENGSRHRFNSVILPPYMRRSPKVTEVLAATLPTWTFERGLRTCLGGVLRQPGRTFVGHHHPPE